MLKESTTEINEQLLTTAAIQINTSTLMLLKEVASKNRMFASLFFNLDAEEVAIAADLTPAQIAFLSNQNRLIFRVGLMHEAKNAPLVAGLLNFGTGV